MSDERYMPDVKVDHARIFRSIAGLLVAGDDAGASALLIAQRVPMENFAGALGVSPPYPGDAPVGTVVTYGWPLPNGPDGAPIYANFQQTIQINTIVAIPLDIPPGPYPVSNDILPSAVSVGTTSPPMYMAALATSPGVLQGAGVLIVSNAPEVSTPWKADGTAKRLWFNFAISRVGIEGQTQANFNFQWSPPH